MFKHLGEIIALFLKLGFIAFGGPAAHIAMLQDEVIDKRSWMSRQHFLDLVGATNLIPGPNSTQMVMHCALERGGFLGLLLGGSAFILPATLLTGILAWFYVAYQEVPQVGALLFGIKPAVIVIILGAVYKLGQKALKGWQLGVIGTLVAAASFAGVNEVIAILAGGVAGLIWLRVMAKTGDKTGSVFPLWALLIPGGTAAAATQVTLAGLFWVFIKIALVLFGSGYVLIAYLEGELVQGLGWLTQAQLIDAIAIGQFTPGPVLSTATFVGLQIAGIEGAILATVGIFLPSFLLVALLNPVIPKLRQKAWAGAFLDAVNISALGIMVAVTVELGIAVLTGWKAWLIFALSALFTFGPKKLSAVWIVLGAALLGYGLSLL